MSVKKSITPDWHIYQLIYNFWQLNMGEQKNTTCAASILMVTSGKVYILGQNAPICHTETKTFQKCIHIKYFLILSRLIYGGCVRI